MGTPIDPRTVPARMGDDVVYAETLFDGAAFLTVTPHYAGAVYAVEAIINGGDWKHDRVIVSVEVEQYRRGIWSASMTAMDRVLFDEDIDLASRALAVTASLIRSLNDAQTAAFWASGFKTVAEEEAR